MKRVVLGGILAGVVVFVWGAISHMLLPLGQMGFKEMPDEAGVVGAMKGGISEPGLYFFPGMDMSRKPTKEEEAAWNAKYEAGPRGILIYHPTGETPMSPKNFALQLGGVVVAGLVAAMIVSMVGGPFAKRMLVAPMLGLFAWLVISVPYWNWYGFPPDFTLAAGIDAVAGWFLGGLVLAGVVKPPR